MPYYQYKADIYCENCVLNAFVGEDQAQRFLAANQGDVSKALDAIASIRHINRYDERTFDLDDFPKVVLDINLQDSDDCQGCGTWVGQLHLILSDDGGLALQQAMTLLEAYPPFPETDEVRSLLRRMIGTGRTRRLR